MEEEEEKGVEEEKEEEEEEELTRWQERHTQGSFVSPHTSHEEEAMLGGRGSAEREERCSQEESGETAKSTWRGREGGKEGWREEGEGREGGREGEREG